jgi:hypothetical protein
MVFKLPKKKHRHEYEKSVVEACALISSPRTPAKRNGRICTVGF